MKTKLKTTVFTLAFISSVTGAFASGISNLVMGKVANTHSWQKYLPDGTTPAGDPQLGDSNGPFADCCFGDGNVCVIGTPIAPGEQVITLRYAQ